MKQDISAGKLHYPKGKRNDLLRLISVGEAVGEAGGDWKSQDLNLFMEIVQVLTEFGKIFAAQSAVKSQS